MPKTKPPYSAEFRQQMVELVGVGKTPAQLAREFGCTAQTIANWVAQSAIDAGKPRPGKEDLTSSEREELNRLRRENRQLRMEREISQKPRPGSPPEARRRPHRLRAREREPGPPAGHDDVPCAEG